MGESPTPGIDSAFHSLGRVFPDEAPTPLTVPSGTPVLDALRLMLAKRYSQVPIQDGTTIRGVFSLWSLARYIARGEGPEVFRLAVEDVMENLPSVNVNTSLYEVLEDLEKHEAVLVISPGGLQAIATSWDVLQYFFSVARPFVLLQEIELALRIVINRAIPEDELEGCINDSVAKAYESKPVAPPSSLEDMTFDDYRTLITSSSNWPRFVPMLGNNKSFVATTLDRIRKIRNRVFHFRTDLEVIDYEDLAATREWLLDRVQVDRSESKPDE